MSDLASSRLFAEGGHDVLTQVLSACITNYMVMNLIDLHTLYRSWCAIFFAAATEASGEVLPQQILN